MPHEIVTLQLGNYANYVGAHFWNIQARSFPGHASLRASQPDAARGSGDSAQDELHATSDEATRNSIDWDVLYREGHDDKVSTVIANEFGRVRAVRRCRWCRRTGRPSCRVWLRWTSRATLVAFGKRRFSLARTRAPTHSRTRTHQSTHDNTPERPRVTDE